MSPGRRANAASTDPGGGRQPAPKRTGRPRNDSRPVVGDPTDDILGTAARLFGERGVAGTTMSLIAKEVGLRQSSLYYYVRNREEVVSKLMERANVVPLALIDEITAATDSVPSKLLRFVTGDVEALCALPFDINEVHRIAARDPEGFADYWSERRRLERRLAALVSSGIEDGVLRTVKPRLTALTIMSNDEGVQNWYRVGPSYRPRQAAQAVAELTVAGLLAPTMSLAAVIDEAATYRS